MAGSSRIISLICRQWRVDPPSVAYAQSVQGAPTNPTRVVLPSVSFRRFCSVWRTKGSWFAGSNVFASLSNCATRSAVRGLSWIWGPLPFTTSNSMPSAGRIVRMSLNMMIPSTPKAFQHCSDNSVAISGFSLLCRKGILSEYLRKSAMYLPAWRMSQTGVRSVASPRAARNSTSWSPGAALMTTLRRGAAVVDNAAALASASAATIRLMAAMFAVAVMTVRVAVTLLIYRCACGLSTTTLQTVRGVAQSLARLHPHNPRDDAVSQAKPAMCMRPC